MSHEAGSDLSRRSFCASVFGVAAVAIGCSKLSGAGSNAVVAGGDVTIEQFSDDGTSSGLVKVPKIVKSDAEWKAQLSEDAYVVTRKEGTELPFSGANLNIHDPGLFRCICCDTALFKSDTKFESGTGWPSFWAPLSKSNVNEIEDSSLGMVRTAVSCKRCDAHLGHVFDDGPKPTGLRYCMNSVALKFVKSAV